MDSQPTYLPPPARPLDLLHQDDALLVVNKPAGLLAVPGRGEDKQDCLLTRLRRDFPDALVVHRLDMATSGLMVFARNIEIQRALSRAFAERQVNKRYVAVLEGRLEGYGAIDLPIAADWPNRPRHKVDAELGKPSLTRYRAGHYEPEADLSHVELEPVTGRTHQLRVHLQAIGHPIIGDTLYQGRAAERLYLHACRLSFTHPATDSSLELFSAAPFPTAKAYAAPADSFAVHHPTTESHHEEA
ncbi:RluA family pseudouridine synthase [Ferriphaselus sp. R-1]|uniref:RluA family pseudouridine synthase n=1 Tax=Ferriphaselus sp. R-1 TaxID=1485544 RepID=UPI0009DDC084|nr:RluA family pseudouridine synthase [Ferriphaselus sp. R-1]